MVYCSSALKAKDQIKAKVQCILRDADIGGDTVLLTGGDGVIMKTWLVDLFAAKIHSDNCDIISIIGTSAINCGISSNKLYYIFMQGHPRSYLKLIQLMGRLKRGNGQQKIQDKLHIFLSLSIFVSVLYSILFSHEDTKERRRQMNEMRTVTRIFSTERQVFQADY